MFTLGIKNIFQISHSGLWNLNPFLQSVGCWLLYGVLKVTKMREGRKRKREKHLPQLYLKFQNVKKRLIKPWKNGCKVANTPLPHSEPCSATWLVG